MTLRNVATFLCAVLGSSPAYCQETVLPVDNVRPLGAVATQLVDMGYAVTYEEAPCDRAELTSDNVSRGRSFLSPRTVPMTFHLSEGPWNEKITESSIPSRLRQKVLSHIELQRLIEEHVRSNNPGKFKILLEGEYAHIVPASRTVNGKTEDFLPLLSTRVQMPPGPSACMGTLKDLFQQLQIARGAAVVMGDVPTSTLMRSECDIAGGNISASEVLMHILTKLSVCCSANREPTGRLVWYLTHDANWNKYFFSIRRAWFAMPGVPNGTTSPAVTSVPQSDGQVKDMRRMGVEAVTSPIIVPVR